MLGDTITISQAASSPWAELPGQVSDDVVLSKVNQDNYGAEYRAVIPDGGRYVLRVRNSVEPATATRSATNRHNVELTYFAPPAEPGGAETPYVVYVIGRFPPVGDTNIAEAIYYALTTVLTEALFGKVLNFES